MQHLILTLSLLFLLPLLATPLAAGEDQAVIVNSGSTNTAGFRIAISRSGEAVYTSQPRRAGPLSGAQAKPLIRQIPTALIKRFYADLNAGKPLASLPNHGCFKSVSFGTTLVVEYRGQRSPDLSCGDQGNTELKALIQDTGEIVKLFDAV